MRWAAAKKYFPNYYVAQLPDSNMDPDQLTLFLHHLFISFLFYFHLTFVCDPAGQPLLDFELKRLQLLVCVAHTRGLLDRSSQWRQRWWRLWNHVSYYIRQSKDLKVQMTLIIFRYEQMDTSKPT